MGNVGRDSNLEPKFEFRGKKLANFSALGNELRKEEKSGKRVEEMDGGGTG